MAGFDRLDTHVSYFQGSVASRWRANVPTWGGVRYTDIYPGLDLEISGQAAKWSWRLVVRNPSTGLAQLANVAWQVGGADQLSLASQQLRLQSAAGNYALPLLQVVDANGAQLSAAQLRAAGASAPSLAGSELRQPFLAMATTGATGPHGLFDILPLNANRPAPRAPAAPLLDGNPPSHQIYGTYLGGESFAVVADTEGNAYVTGITFDADFTYTVGYTQTQNAYADGYVIKVSSDGSSLFYLTHLGGDQDDFLRDVAVDGNGAAYVTGISFSSDYPTTGNAYDTTPSGPLLSKLSADGTELEYSGYLNDNGVGEGIAVRPDVPDVVYVAGYTDSSDFPYTANAYDPTDYANIDAFLTVIDTTQSGTDALVYSTVLPADHADCYADVGGCDVAVDRYGYVYLSGQTGSDDFPTTANGFSQTAFGQNDAFLLKLDITISGTAGLLYGTYLGGSGNECYQACFVAVNGNQSAYITGSTDSTDFITSTNAYSGTYGGGEFDSFVARIDTTRSGAGSLVYSTYVGGPAGDYSMDIGVNAAGEATISGRSDGDGYPVTADALQPTYNGGDCGFPCRDAILTRLSADGTRLLYSSYVGAENDDNGRGVAVQPHNDSIAYIVGQTQSSGFTMTDGVYYHDWFPGANGYLMKFSLTTCQTTP